MGTAQWEGEVVHLATLEIRMLDNRMKRLNVSFLISQTRAQGTHLEGANYNPFKLTGLLNN
jgi:hypothetical protein